MVSLFGVRPLATPWVTALVVGCAAAALAPRARANPGTHEYYYVAPWGSASATGASPSAPTTLERANSLVDGPGDLVFLLSGVYTSTSTRADNIRPAASGDAIAPISYMPASGAVPILTADGTSSGIAELNGERACINLIDRSHVTVSGITCRGAPSYLAAAEYKVHHGAFLRRSTGILLQNNTFLYLLDTGVTLDKYGGGADTAYNRVEGNRIEYVGCVDFTTPTGEVTPDCTVPLPGGAADGINLAGAHHNAIVGNTVGNIQHNAIQLRNSNASNTSDNRVADNVVSNSWHASINLAEDPGYETRRNVISGNTLILAGTVPDQFVPVNAGNPVGITVHAPENIVRFNRLVGVGGPGISLNPGGTCTSYPALFRNKLYGNSVSSGLYAGIDMSRGFSCTNAQTDWSGNSFVNNAVFDNTASNATSYPSTIYTASTQVYLQLGDGDLQGTEFRNNLLGDTLATSAELVFGINAHGVMPTGCRAVNDVETNSSCRYGGSFTKNTPSTATPYTTSVNKGDYLTKTVSCSGSSTSVVVNDARYFSKGIAGIADGDTIEIEGVLETRTIIDITYGPDTLVLDAIPYGCAANRGVATEWLGPKPDIGGPN